MKRIKSTTQLPPYMMFPRFLLDIELSANAVMVYLLLLDRARLSLSNSGWKDLLGNVFIFFPLEELAAALHCSIRTITTSLHQLSEKGLIERVRQGIGRANIIYVCLPDASPDIHSQESSNQTGRNLPSKLETSCQSHLQESSSLNGNNLPRNNNEEERTTKQQQKSNTSRTAYGRFQNVFLSDEEYHRLTADFSRLHAMIDDMSCYLAYSGKKYQNYEAALRSWAKNNQSAYMARNYVKREGESL